MTRALVVDQSLLPAPAGATVLASPTFPGAAGAAWPTADWTILAGSPAGTATQDGAGYGALTPNNGAAWNGSTVTAVHKTVSAVDMELTGRFLTPGTNGYVPQFWPTIGVGAPTSGAFGSEGEFTQGVTLIAALGNGSWSVAAPGGVSLSGDLPQTWTQQTAYGYRLRRKVAAGVATVSARVWPAASAEPTTWTYTGTTSIAAALPAGTIAFSAGQGGDTESRTFKHTGLTVTNAG